MAAPELLMVGDTNKVKNIYNALIIEINVPLNASGLDLTKFQKPFKLHFVLSRLSFPISTRFITMKYVYYQSFINKTSTHLLFVII